MHARILRREIARPDLHLPRRSASRRGRTTCHDGARRRSALQPARSSQWPGRRGVVQQHELSADRVDRNLLTAVVLPGIRDREPAAVQLEASDDARSVVAATRPAGSARAPADRFGVALQVRHRDRAPAVRTRSRCPVFWRSTEANPTSRRSRAREPRVALLGDRLRNGRRRSRRYAADGSPREFVTSQPSAARSDPHPREWIGDAGHAPRARRTGSRGRRDQPERRPATAHSHRDRWHSRCSRRRGPGARRRSGP